MVANPTWSTSISGFLADFVAMVKIRAFPCLLVVEARLVEASVSAAVGDRICYGGVVWFFLEVHHDNMFFAVVSYGQKATPPPSRVDDGEFRPMPAGLHQPPGRYVVSETLWL